MRHFEIKLVFCQIIVLQLFTSSEAWILFAKAYHVLSDVYHPKLQLSTTTLQHGTCGVIVFRATKSNFVFKFNFVIFRSTVLHHKEGEKYEI